jgi:hypothetical protein
VVETGETAPYPGLEPGGGSAARLSRLFLRREFQSRHIFLDGEPKPFAELSILKVPFVDVMKQEKKTATVELPWLHEHPSPLAG